MSLELACAGKSKSTGGLNLPELKTELIAKYPENRNQILSAKNRKDLEDLCRQLMGVIIPPSPSFARPTASSRSPSISPKKVSAGKQYFTEDAPEIYQDSESMPARYCRCIAHTAKQQPDWCLKEKAWYQKREGKGCYNPYAVCTKSIKRTGNVECFPYYDLENLPEEEQMAFMYLKNKNNLNELYQEYQKDRQKYGLSGRKYSPQVSPTKPLTVKKPLQLKLKKTKSALTQSPPQSPTRLSPQLSPRSPARSPARSPPKSDFRVIITKSGKGVWVCGSTTPIKDSLKELGGKWNASKKCWVFTKAKLPSILELLGLPESIIEQEE